MLKYSSTSYCPPQKNHAQPKGEKKISCPENCQPELHPPATPFSRKILYRPSLSNCGNVVLHVMFGGRITRQLLV